ncbi:MAG TPA: hypothetical protein VJY62_01860 [Bacteroidia bacterium]|nr:hypothetical protein [Bacteroidia bacterium]
MKAVFIFIISIFFFISCGDDKTVPGTYVDTYIYLSEPSAIQLNAIGGWIYHTGGAKGLIVYRKSNNEYAAFDRQCTYDPNAACSILQVASGLTVVDSCCGSQFNLPYGTVTKGPASQQMIQYRTYSDGNTVHIYN